MATRTPSDEHGIFRAYLDAVGLHAVAGAAAVGLQASERYALSQIALDGGLTSGQLAARIGLTTGATSRLIDRLERAGFVRRVANPADRRKVIVEPVPGAGARIEEVVAPARRRIAAVLDRYTPSNARCCSTASPMRRLRSARRPRNSAPPADLVVSDLPMG